MTNVNILTSTLFILRHIVTTEVGRFVDFVSSDPVRMPSLIPPLGFVINPYMLNSCHQAETDQRS